MAIGDKIGEARRARKMSQSDLAELLGVTRQSVSKWELNVTEPDSAKLINLSIIFEVGVEYFYSDSIYSIYKKQRIKDNIFVAHKILFLAGIVLVALSFAFSIIFPYRRYINGKMYSGFIAYLISDRYYAIKMIFFVGVGSLFLSTIVPIDTSKPTKEKKDNKKKPGKKEAQK